MLDNDCLKGTVEAYLDLFNCYVGNHVTEKIKKLKIVATEKMINLIDRTHIMLLRGELILPVYSSVARGYLTNLEDNLEDKMQVLLGD